MNQDIYNRMYEVWLHDMLEPEEKLFVGRAPKPRHEIKGWQMRGYNPNPTEEEKQQSIDEYMKRQELTEQEKDERNNAYLKSKGK